MSSLVLESLEIHNFRSFRRLCVERLARVNLIVGKNNVGKTNLLEALQLYATHGALSTVWEQLQGREEGVNGNHYRWIPSPPTERSISERITSLRHLFYGWPALAQLPLSIIIGSLHADERKLRIRIRRHSTAMDGSERTADDDVYPARLLYEAIHPRRKSYRVMLEEYVRNPALVEPEPDRIRVSFIPANGLTRQQLGTLWDNTILQGNRQLAIKALQLLEGRVRDLNLIERRDLSRERVPIVQLANGDNGFPPIPLSSLGEGMNRLFAIANALVNAQGGMCLIDEVESGLHYSVQPDVWRLIFNLASRFNIQVFATTHSRDAISAFQEVAQEHEEEGLLLSLREKVGKPGEVAAVPYSEERLGVALQHQAEVR